MVINIQADIQLLKEYANSSNPQTVGLLRGSDGTLRKVTIFDQSIQTATISNIIKELLTNPNLSILTSEEFRLLIGLVNKSPNQQDLVKEIVIKGLMARKLFFASNDLVDCYCNDKEVVLAAIQQGGSALYFASIELKNDKEVVLTAVRQNGITLKYASAELKNDKDVVLAAVQHCWRAFEFASDELKNDKNFVFIMIQQNGLILEHVSTELKHDKEVVLAAVRENGVSLLCACIELKHDKEVVLTAVRQNGLALEDASIELKHDKQVVLAAVCQNIRALHYADSTYKNNPVIQLAAQIYHNHQLVIVNLSIQTLFEEWYPYLSNHVNLPVLNKIIEVFDDPKLRDFEKRQLLINLFDLMIFLTDEVISSDSAARIIQAIFTFVNPAARGRLVAIFNQLSLIELNAISSQPPKKTTNKTLFELRIKVLLTRLNYVIGSLKFTLDRAEVVYANFLKDTKVQVIVFSYLEMIINIYPQLNESQKNKLILGAQNDLKQPLKLGLIKKFALLTSLGLIFDKDAVIEVIDNSKEEIEAYFVKEFNKLFQGKSIVQDSELSLQVASRYQETFAKFRQPMAIFTYLKSVKQVGKEVCEALTEYVYHVLKGDFDQFRNKQVEDQPHLAELYQKEGLKEVWLTQLPSIELTESGVVKPLDVVEFFHQKVVIDNHFQDTDLPHSNILKEYLKQAIKNAHVDHLPYLRMLEEHKEKIALNVPFDKILDARNQLEVLIIKFCAKTINIEIFKQERESLYQDRALQINDVEKALSHDFEVLYQEPLVASAGTKYVLGFTTDPNDLLLIGTEVQGSCQNINGQPRLNQCLLGYMINGESQAIVIKDNCMRIVGRGVVRLLSDDKGDPVLFLERLYLNKQLDSWKEAIISMAKEKAKTMKLPLLSKEVGKGEPVEGAFYFRGGRAPFIYSDASGGVLNGQEGFKITGAHILLKPQ